MKRLFLLLLIVTVPVFAQHTYYVSKSTGLDTRTAAQAQVPSTPWAHIPGMPSCTSNCASYSPVAGDKFILKGGDTWVSSDLGITWSWGGNATNCVLPYGSGATSSCVYIGVDQTYFSGASWARPIFDLQNTQGAQQHLNGLIWIDSANWVIFDNIEVTHYSQLANNGLMIFEPFASNTEVMNCYIHAWTRSAGSITQNSFAYNNNFGESGGAINNWFDHNVVDGSDATNNDFFGGALHGYNVWGNVIRFTYNQMNGNFKRIWGNLLDHDVDASTGSGDHCNDMRVGGIAGGEPSTLWIYNNILSNASCNGGSNLYAIADDTCPTCVSYIYNNILFNNPLSFDPAITIGGHQSSGTYNYYNNTIQSIGECFRNGDAAAGAQIANYGNTHCIQPAATAICSGPNVTCNDKGGNLQQTTAQADANVTPKFDQYTASQVFVYSPVAGTNSTVNAGINQTSLCTGNVAALCSDTTYAGYNTTNHTVTMRAVNARGSTWDIGAYEFSGGPSSNTVVTVTTDGSGSSHVGTAMTTALSYANVDPFANTQPQTCTTNIGTNNICYTGSTLTVTGSLCTGASPCTWTLKDNNGTVIPAVSPTTNAINYIGSELTTNPPTYVSGVTATGSTNQFCVLTGFNGGGTGAVAELVLTGTNTIGTSLVITNAGSGFTSAPTTATVASGTATCSGTPVITTTIGNPVTPLGQIDCTGSSANTTCVYNAPQEYPPTQKITITVTDGTTSANATVGFTYINGLNEWFTHRGRTLSVCPPGGSCTTGLATAGGGSTLGYTINNIPWSVYKKATSPVTYQSNQVTFLNTLTNNTEISIIGLSSDPNSGINMPFGIGSGINRPTMSYNGKWLYWYTDTPVPFGGFTGLSGWAQNINGSVLQNIVCGGAMMEKNQPGWLLANDGTNLQICDMENSQTLTNVIAHGMTAPKGFSYEGGVSDSIYTLKTPNVNGTCPGPTVSCSVNLASFDLSPCYGNLTLNCASLVGGQWSSFVQGTGIFNPVYGWDEQGNPHCSESILVSTDKPAPNCEWHYHDIWSIPKSNFLAGLYGPGGQPGESIFYEFPTTGGLLDPNACASPAAWPSTNGTVTCLAPNTFTSNHGTAFWSHPAFNQAVNYLVAYAGKPNCTPSGHTCTNPGSANNVIDMRTNTLVYSLSEVVGHSAWDGYDTDHFDHDGGFRNQSDIVNNCVNEALREVTISTNTSTPLLRTGCRPESNVGNSNNYLQSPTQSPDATRIGWVSSDSQQLDIMSINLGWVAQTRTPAAPVSVNLGSSGSARIQWTGATLNREAMLYWVYKQPSCTGAWTRLSSASPVNWTTTGYVPSLHAYTDSTLTTGQNACYGVTSQDWGGVESSSLSNTIKVTNTSGTFASVAQSGPGTTFSIAAPSDVTALAVSQKLLCATGCASVNTPHAPTVTTSPNGAVAAGTYFGMVVYGKCIDFPNCTNFKGTLPSLASVSQVLNGTQYMVIETTPTEMVGQDAVQLYMNTAATPASAFHLQTIAGCSPRAVVSGGTTAVVLNTFNEQAGNKLFCLINSYNASGAAPPATNTAVGGYNLTWTDPGGAGNRFMQVYYREGSPVQIVSELAAQTFLIATPPVGAQSFYDAFPNQTLAPANIHYAVVVKNMDGTRSPGVCMNGAGVTEICSGSSGTTTATLSPNLPFGNQNVGTTSSPLTTTLTNTGSLAVNVTSTSLVGPGFANTGTGTCTVPPFTLQPNTFCTYTFTFTPTSATTFNGTFTVNSNAPQVSVSLTGQGTQATTTLLPSTLAFGNEYTNATSSALLTSIANTGSGSISVTNITISGNASFVNSGTGTCVGTSFTLNAGTSCTIAITFSPTVLGLANATLSVTSNSVSSPNTATLTGNGIPVQVFTGSGSMSGQGSVVVHP